MYGACYINGTWSNQVGWLKLYDSGKPQRGGTSFLGGVHPSRHHALKKTTYHILGILLHSTEGYSRYKTKVKVNNNLIRSSPPLIKNTKEIRFFWKVSKYRVFAGRYFPIFGMNIEIYGENLHVQSEYR